MTITGVVTFIAAYHYVRIFESWEAAFNVADGTIATTGYAFGKGHRYADWLLTVPHMILLDRFRREYLPAPTLA
jgi:bacteriorhodopsin